MLRNTLQVPLNAVIISFLVTALLSLINIGSYVALNAVLSLTIAALITSYVIVIGCLVIKRVRGEALPERRWSLGKWGLPINIAALCFLAPIYVFTFFPLATPVDPSTMNWSVVMYAGILGFAAIYYVVHGHKVYTAPVSLVKRMEYSR
jgi:amino acid transporter